ncbi:lipoprotein-releasing system permease protein [Chitinophaga costaii]|uniref:Lipoprotein-releasing system permease protein n=1 Tax=Chitinophaga costaii TaxID=1335309 RepID=A0A1C3ZQ32_9BACT|nr:FtsX-like permease family protein [Chitinophaga costaii]PUZ30461.1 ABC transporter permease [Chitinophaga costaii]SCB84509.1 lipoprotein-releasing system permease protein [Chitinophaga costaii]
MRISSFIAGRIAFNKSSSFSRFIIRIAIAATAVSVAVMILATALVAGFQQTIQGKIFSFWGHLHITQFQPNAGPLTDELPFPDRQTLVDSVRNIPGIGNVQAYATKSAMIKANNGIEGVIFKGVDRHYDWQQLQRFMRQGGALHFNDSTYSLDIIISEHTAKALQLQLYDPLIVYFIQGNGQPPRARKLKITGIYKTSIEDYDKTFIIGDISLIRRLNDWAPQDVGGYEVFVKDVRQLDTLSHQVYNILPQQLDVRSIKEIYPNIFDWLGLQDKTEALVLVIMTIVALINMITAILILILERTNMVGVLKALGMRNGSIRAVFIYQCAYILGAGILLGNVLGLGLAFVQLKTGFFKLQEDAYYMPVAAISIQWGKILVINLGTFIVCTCTLIVPSLLISRIAPLKAIRFK